MGQERQPQRQWPQPFPTVAMAGDLVVAESGIENILPRRWKKLPPVVLPNHSTRLLQYLRRHNDCQNHDRVLPTLLSHQPQNGMLQLLPSRFPAVPHHRLTVPPLNPKSPPPTCVRETRWSLVLLSPRLSQTFGVSLGDLEM